MRRMGVVGGATAGVIQRVSEEELVCLQSCSWFVFQPPHDPSCSSAGCRF